MYFCSVPIVLRLAQADVGESEENFDVNSWAYVFTLPRLFPEMSSLPGSNIVFLRNDDIGLMKVLM